MNHPHDSEAGVPDPDRLPFLVIRELSDLSPHKTLPAFYEPKS